MQRQGRNYSSQENHQGRFNQGQTWGRGSRANSGPYEGSRFQRDGGRTQQTWESSSDYNQDFGSEYSPESSVRNSSWDANYRSAASEGYGHLGRGFQSADRLDYGSDNYTFNQYPAEGYRSQYPSRDYSRESYSQNNYDRPQQFGSQRWSQPIQQGQPSQYGQQWSAQGSSWNQGRYTRSQETGRGPKGYRRSDERLREDVCEALSHHRDIDASEVEVNVSEGVLTLTGTVEHRQMKRAIEDIVDHISGITDVKNEIKVQSQISRGQQTDPAVSASMGATSNTKLGATSQQSGKSSSSTTRHS